MQLPEIIQGGMGVGVSDWRLARSVSAAGQLGVVSGTGIALVMISRLAQGDPGGHVRRALAQFPAQAPVERALATYLNTSGRPNGGRDLPPRWSVEPARELVELTVLANFVEVWLAREGHTNPVGINLLEKIQMPTLASLYGAMLAGVDVVIIGAGIPYQVAGVLDRLARHQPVGYRLDVRGVGSDAPLEMKLDPATLFPELANGAEQLKRPQFLPIISSVVLAKTLLKRGTGRVDGFVVEAPTAGGHNAPPRGGPSLDEDGMLVYGPKDTVDLQRLSALGVPFWVAGGEDTAERLHNALAAGAAGIQVGTAFAYCRESGLDDELKRRVLEAMLDGRVGVRSDPVVSPTGYPFKVVDLEGTLSDPAVYRSRKRICDIGMLVQPVRLEDGSVVLRCPAESISGFRAKGGDPDGTEGRVCLCNALLATAGFPRRHRDGRVEPPIVTSGDALAGLGRFLRPGETSYGAVDVLEQLLDPLDKRPAPRRPGIAGEESVLTHSPGQP